MDSTLGLQQVDLICHLKTQTQNVLHIDKRTSEPVSSFIVGHGGSLGLWGLWGDMALGHLAGSGLKLCGKKVGEGSG